MEYRVFKSVATFAVLLLGYFNGMSQSLTYRIADTGVKEYSDNSAQIAAPPSGGDFYGQDANYQYNEPAYTDNGNGTISDLVTGLMWQKEMGYKISYQEAFVKADTMALGGYSDWRVPTIKELFSLINYSGRVKGPKAVRMFIDTLYFCQPIGNTSIGEREIDAQTWSSTQYLELTMNRDSTVFGVNFIDGRVKGYPKYNPGSRKTVPRTMYFRMVRGNTKYGINNLINNQDGTVTDVATGLMWQQADDGNGRNWQDALAYAEQLTLANHNDWRLPNAKELQSIVDYSRSPSKTISPAINQLFHVTGVNDPDGNPGHYPYFWTSTTLQDGVNPYLSAVYVSFGRAYGKMIGKLIDAHGAGAVRSDPKSGLPAEYPSFFGPQGDARIVFNYVRCVRIVTSGK